MNQTVYQQIKIQKQNIINMNRSKSSGVFYTGLCSDIIQSQDTQQDNFIKNLISKRHESIYNNCNDYNEGWIKALQQKDQLSSRQKYVETKSIKYGSRQSQLYRSNSGEFRYSQFLKQVTDSKDFKQVDQYIPMQNQQKLIQTSQQKFLDINNINFRNKNKIPLNIYNSNHNHNHKHIKNNINAKKIKNNKKHLINKNMIPISNSDQLQDILPDLSQTQISDNVNYINIKALQKHPSLQTNPSTPKNLETAREDLIQDRSIPVDLNIKKKVDKNLIRNDIRCQKSLQKNIENLIAQPKQQISKRQWVHLKMKARSLQNSVSILRKQKKLYTMKLLQYQIQMDKLIYELQLLRTQSKNILCNNCNCNINTISNMSNTNNTNNNSNSQLRYTLQGSTNSYNSCNSSCQYPITAQQLENLKQMASDQKQAKQTAYKERDLLIKQLNQALCNHQSETTILRTEIKSAVDKLSQFQKQKTLLFELHKEQTIKINNLLHNISNNQLNIKQLTYYIQEISHRFQQTISTSCSLQQEINCLNKEVSQLNQECDLLFEALQGTRYDLEIEKNVSMNFEKVIKDKDLVIQEMSKEIYEYRNKLQDFVADNEEVKTIFCRYEDRILQLQSIIQNKDENIQNLYNKIDNLSILIQEIRSNQNNKAVVTQSQNQNLIQQINIMEQKHINHQKYLQQAYCLLKIPLNNPSFPHLTLYSQESILQEIQALLQHNRYNCQIVGDYRQILQMFNISHRDQLYHQKLLLEITQFRNNIANLVKKLRIMEKKVGVLTEENRKYVNIIKTGCEESVQQLQRLVQEQNEEIVKYRLHLQNITFSHHYQTREF